MQRIDLLIRNRVGVPIAAVETKRLRGKDAAWAESFLEQLFHYPSFRNAPFVVLAFLDRLYVGRNEAGTDGAPRLVRIAECDAVPIWEPYFRRVGLTSATIEPGPFETTVERFFQDVAADDSTPSAEPGLRLLREAAPEFLDAVRGGRVEAEAAA